MEDFEYRSKGGLLADYNSGLRPESDRPAETPITPEKNIPKNSEHVSRFMSDEEIYDFSEKATESLSEHTISKEKTPNIDE